MSNILEKDKHHPSVNKISQTFMANEKLSFQFVMEDQVRMYMVLITPWFN